MKRSTQRSSSAKKKAKVKESTPEEPEVEDFDSDALDEDDNGEALKRARKHRRVSTKRRKLDEEDASDDLEMVGKIVEAPKTGKVPPGQISQNTLDFLKKLQDPKCNDRGWFRLQEPVYRAAEAEWKAFIESFTHTLIEADPQVPSLPPKDVIHRIYRDMRFSNDKTPYKTNLSASLSRSGRKGIFAGYHVSIKPGGESMIAAGSWCPARNELATIRSHILHDASRLRDVISTPEFVERFGEAKPHPKGKIRNVFGREGELKVAPKGVDKDHTDIDLLKCRSFAVVYRFKDEEVLSPDFKEELGKMVHIMRPLVYCLNDYMTVGIEDEEST